MNKIVIGGNEYNLPEFKFGIMKKLWPYMQPKDINAENIVLTVLDESEKIILICLKASYPDISDDFIENNAEFTEVGDAMLVIRPLIQEAITKKKTVTQETNLFQITESQVNGTGDTSTDV